MKILIDTRVAPRHMTGMGYVVKNIIGHLTDLDGDIKYTFLGEIGRDGQSMRHVHIGGLFKRGFNFLWKVFSFPSVSWFLGSFDIVFFPNYGDFPVRATKRIVLIADLSYILFPQFLEQKNLAFLRRQIPQVIKRSDCIVTISHTVKNEIIQYLGVAADTVVVLPLAANEKIIPIDPREARLSVAEHFGVTNPYILSVGTLEPRKNILAALKAYAGLPQNIRESFDFVIVGSKDRSFPGIQDFIRANGLEDRVHVLGYVANHEDVSMLYSGAQLVVIPSLYEGFGMPVLEALKCGTPVLANDIPVFRETFADMIEYGNPSEDSFSQRLALLLTNPLLSEGRDRRQNFATQFNWDKTVDQLSSLFNSIHEDRN